MTRAIILSSRLDTLPVVFMSRLEGQAVEVVGVVEDEGALPSRWKYYRSRLRKVLRIGILGPLLYRRRYVSVTTGLSMGDAQAVFRQAGCPVVRVPSVNSPATGRAVAAWTFDVALSLGNRYITPATQQAIGKPILNVHHGKVPEFRGGPPIFWEVHAGLERAGYTIHLVDHGLDTGPILGEGAAPIRYEPTLRETLKETWLGLMPMSMDHLLMITADLGAALRRQKPQPEADHRHRTTPSLRHILQAEWRVRQRHGRGDRSR